MHSRPNFYLFCFPHPARSAESAPQGWNPACLLQSPPFSVLCRPTVGVEIGRFLSFYILPGPFRAGCRGGISLISCFLHLLHPRGAGKGDFFAKPPKISRRLNRYLNSAIILISLVFSHTFHDWYTFFVSTFLDRYKLLSEIFQNGAKF